jgi:hypothetical protein
VFTFTLLGLAAFPGAMAASPIIGQDANNGHTQNHLASFKGTWIVRKIASERSLLDALLCNREEWEIRVDGHDLSLIRTEKNDYDCKVDIDLRPAAITYNGELLSFVSEETRGEFEGVIHIKTMYAIKTVNFDHIKGIWSSEVIFDRFLGISKANARGTVEMIRKYAEPQGSAKTFVLPGASRS